ncbi:hypothetical protein ACFWPK_31840 [Nocardia sp. NPDC058519]|uniref:hypothetical protein n=1 Tax=Nocardia sp. NPDC058519 TaxID=3346535 RepID=UPI00365FF074
MNENSSTARDTDHRRIVWRVDRYRRTGRLHPGFVRSRTMTNNPPTGTPAEPSPAESPQHRSPRSDWNRRLLVAAGLLAADAVTGEVVGRLVDAALVFLGTL